MIIEKEAKLTSFVYSRRIPWQKDSKKIGPKSANLQKRKSPTNYSQNSGPTRAIIITKSYDFYEP